MAPRSRPRRLLQGLGLGAALCGPVAAEDFALTYSFSFGATLRAEVTGTLQDDGRTVHVEAVRNPRLGGTAGPPLVFLTSLSDLVAGRGTAPPILTLDGQGHDMSACSDPTCTAGFITFDGVRQVFGAPGVFTSPAFGDTMSGGANAMEPYDAARFSLTPVSP